VGEHAPEPGESLLAAFELLGEGVRRLHALEGPIPWNAWLHTGAHWHFEVVPRLTVFAGLELGAGIWVNSLAPERAAEALAAANQPGGCSRGSGGPPRSRRRGSGPCPSPA
jgi:hypothetical protein